MDYYSVPEIITQYQRLSGFLFSFFLVRLVEPDPVSDIFGCFPNLDRYDIENLHPWVRVDQACRPLSPKTLSILVGLTFKLVSLCSHY